ncbi:RNA polymerase sigma-54 factor [bacterium E08(2017)]|nr:RNA polymerase sigma-54 factor [bacterium E08(2017)]
MAMQSQSLSLAQVQRLQMVLAPQLRQSLEMLQLPIMELRGMIQQELEKNPTIEEIPTENKTLEIEPGTNTTDNKDANFEKEFEVLAKLDDEWRDYFFQDMQSNPYSSQDAEKRQFLLDSLQKMESLQEHLINQLQLAGLSEEDMQAGELIIGSINEDGYLASSVEELATLTGYDQARLEEVLHIVKDFHPTGVASTDLRDCLLTQLDRSGQRDTLAGDIVDKHIDQLGTRKYHDIAKSLKVSVEEVQDAAKIIGTLNPKPGRIYTDDPTTYVLPEVVVQKVNGEYVIVLNDDQLPHIRISNHYRRLMKAAETKKEVRDYIRERIQAGAFLVKSIQQRQKTIYRIATEIVNAQTDFLDHGVSKLKPMTMADLASTVGVHETTVSRAVNNKYMQTPIGLFEMKYFFTTGIQTSDGNEISNESVKDIIAGLVAEEDPVKPLSDQAIMEELKERGIKIARRTIAKYRLLLHIPPSHLRKIY